MDTPADLAAEFEEDSTAPFTDVRYSLPVLLREVKRDRSSATFAMEKLDQDAINLLFRQRRSARDAKLNP